MCAMQFVNLSNNLILCYTSRLFRSTIFHHQQQLGNTFKIIFSSIHNCIIYRKLKSLWGSKTSQFQKNPCKRQGLMKCKGMSHSGPKKPRCFYPTLLTLNWNWAMVQASNTQIQPAYNSRPTVSTSCGTLLRIIDKHPNEVNLAD